MAAELSAIAQAGVAVFFIFFVGVLPKLGMSHL